VTLLCPLETWTFTFTVCGVSRLFLVPKKNGKMRPVINLSVLNQHLIVPHFKMETNRSITIFLWYKKKAGIETWSKRRVH
jgi:hypothetical protein